MARIKQKAGQGESGLFNSWEFHERVNLEVNGKTIRVSEWRKEFKDGTAVIRLGYLRIDNSPRFQIIILFNGVRVMANRPPFRNFDNALDAANLWLDYDANRMQSQNRMLTAVPASRWALQIPAPAEMPPIDKIPRHRQATVRESVAVKRLSTDEINVIIREEYYKLDHGRTSLRKLQDAVSYRAGYRVSMPVIQKRTGSDGLPMLEDKKRAIAIARPIVKKAMARIIKENPDFGFGRCYELLEKSELAGYRKIWVRKIYYEARKESGVLAKAHPRR